MAEVDPETLLEWLQMGQGDERDMQLIALEQLCMLLLMSGMVTDKLSIANERKISLFKCKVVFLLLKIYTPVKFSVLNLVF